MAKKVELKKYTVTVPITVEVQFRVLSDSEKNALEIVKNSNASLDFEDGAVYVEDELFYTDNFEQDVFPYHGNHFVNEELRHGYKWDETEIKPSKYYSSERDGQIGWNELNNSRIEENGCVIHYIPDED